MSNTNFSRETKTFNVFGDFLEAVINCFLYQRKTYHRVAFSPFNIFGVQIQVCTHPDVKKYIYECVESLRSQFSQIRELRVVIKLPADSASSGDSDCIESLVIRLDGISDEFLRWDHNGTVLQNYFATSLLRLNLLDCIYPAADFETTWELRVRLASEESNLSHSTPMSWYISNQCTLGGEEATIYPIVSFDNEDLQMQLLFEHRSQTN